MSINVLIVEDEPIPATYLKSIIEDCEGYSVEGIVTNASDAISFIHKHKIDVVCMDVMLEGSEDGSQLAIRIKDMYRNIEILFLTAYSEEEMIEYAVEAHAFAYLLKPYRTNEIKATLQLLKAKLKDTPIEESIDNNITVVQLINGYSYNIETQTLLHGSDKVDLGKKEIQFLDLLCKNKDSILDSDTIFDKLNASDDSIRSIIYRIRKATVKDLIVSIKGYGYKIATA